MKKKLREIEEVYNISNEFHKAQIYSEIIKPIWEMIGAGKLIGQIKDYDKDLEEFEIAKHGMDLETYHSHRHVFNAKDKICTELKEKLSKLMQENQEVEFILSKYQSDLLLDAVINSENN